jgi:thioredoxin-related protein
MPSTFYLYSAAVSRVGRNSIAPHFGKPCSLAVSFNNNNYQVNIQDMRKKCNIILTVVLFLTTTFVSGQSKKIPITGTLTGFPKNSLVRLYSTSGTVVDSCFIIDSKFKIFKNISQQAGQYGFRVTNTDSIDMAQPLFLGNEPIRINGNKATFADKLIVSGSPNHTLMKNLDSILSDVTNERNSLLAEYLKIKQEGLMTDSIKNIFWGQAGSIKMLDDERLHREKAFIATHINSYFSLFLLSVLKPNYEKDELKKLLSKVNPTFRKSNYFNAIQTSLKHKSLQKGGKFIDFSAFDKNENIVKFSNYFTKEYTLLDFSTPYCQFCVSALEPLKKLAADNSSKLQIVTFYVDEEKNGHDKYLEKSQKPWTVLWDKKGRFGEAYSIYNIDGTPTFFLFDKSGTLILQQDGYDADFFVEVSKRINQ